MLAGYISCCFIGTISYNETKTYRIKFKSSIRLSKNKSSNSLSGALLYHGRRGIAEFPLKIGKINMLSYDDLPKFRGIAEFGF